MHLQKISLAVLAHIFIPEGIAKGYMKDYCGFADGPINLITTIGKHIYDMKITPREFLTSIGFEGVEGSTD